MPDLTPIRRWYRGVHFRSTLEADWAATFYALGITWCYEPEAYVLLDGEPPYSPDFWLPAQHVWFEVKGPHNDRLDKTLRFAEQETNEAWSMDPREPIVVIGRPAESGVAKMEGALNYPDQAWFYECPICQHYSICCTSLSWNCRVCWQRDEERRPHKIPLDILFQHAREDPE